MARFKGDIRGSGSLISRLGTKLSGVLAHVCGWNIGIRVVGSVDDDQDIFRVYLTGGSKNPSVVVIGEFMEGSSRVLSAAEKYRAVEMYESDDVQIGNVCTEAEGGVWAQAMAWVPNE